MTTFVPGFLTEVYMGEYDWTEFFHDADMTAEQDIHATPTFRVKGKRKTHGQDGGTFSLEGWWHRTQDEGDTDGPEEYFTGIFDGRTRVPICVSPDGGSLGDIARCALIRTATYNPTISTDAAQAFTLELEADRGIDFGKIVKTRGELTADDTGAAVNLEVDFAASIGRAYLHVFTIDGTTPTLDVVVETSANGTTGWATAGTFAQVTTTPGWQVINLTSLNQYVRVDVTITGTSPSYIFAVAVCPRYEA